MKTLAKFSELLKRLKETFFDKKVTEAPVPTPTPVRKARKKKSLLQEEDAHLFI